MRDRYSILPCHFRGADLRDQLKIPHSLADCDSQLVGDPRHTAFIQLNPRGDPGCPRLRYKHSQGSPGSLTDPYAFVCLLHYPANTFKSMAYNESEINSQSLGGLGRDLLA
jgi:hypothetical protein